MATVIDDTIKDRLAGVSVATLSTALFKRGLRNQTLQDVHPVRPKGRNMVGPAFTLRFIPAREDLNQLPVYEDPEHPQRKAVETCPPSAILVIDSRGDARAASAGDILVTRLQMRGVAGVVTDGGFRDAMDIAELDIPAYHRRPSPPTSLTLHHAIDINVPIGCGGVAVFPDDILVGDDDGVIVLPAHLVGEVTAEAVEMTAFEDFVVEQVKAGASIVGLYPPSNPETREKFKAWRREHGR